MTGIVLWVLRNHFADTNHIVAPRLKNLQWVKDVTQTKIVIDPALEWKAQNLQQRPGVFVKRNQWAIERLGIGDRYHFRVPGLRVGECNSTCEDKFVDSGDKFEVLVIGSSTVFCISRSAAEAEEIGWEATGQILGFSSRIVHDMDLNRFRVMEVGGAAKLEEASEYWAVPINVAYAFFRAWTVSEIGPMLKSFSINANGGDQ
jgi:hypothetical protein